MRVWDKRGRQVGRRNLTPNEETIMASGPAARHNHLRSEYMLAVRGMHDVQHKHDLHEA